MQKVWKALKNKYNQELSCVDPQTYCTRFNNGFTQMFEIAEEIVEN